MSFYTPKAVRFFHLFFVLRERSYGGAENAGVEKSGAITDGKP